MRGEQRPCKAAGGAGFAAEQSLAVRQSLAARLASRPSATWVWREVASATWVWREVAMSPGDVPVKVWRRCQGSGARGRAPLGFGDVTWRGVGAALAKAPLCRCPLRVARVSAKSVLADPRRPSSKGSRGSPRRLEPQRPPRTATATDTMRQPPVFTRHVSLRAAASGHGYYRDSHAGVQHLVGPTADGAWRGRPSGAGLRPDPAIAGPDPPIFVRNAPGTRP